MFEDGSTDPCIKNCHARLTENPTCSGRIQTAGIVACALGIWLVVVLKKMKALYNSKIES